MSGFAADVERARTIRPRPPKPELSGGRPKFFSRMIMLLHNHIVAVHGRRVRHARRPATASFVPASTAHLAAFRIRTDPEYDSVGARDGSSRPDRAAVRSC